MIGALVDGTLTVAAGAAGGLVVAASHRLLRPGGRRVVPLEVGQRIAEPDGREWVIVSRSFDMAPNRAPNLTVALVLHEDAVERRKAGQ